MTKNILFDVGLVVGFTLTLLTHHTQRCSTYIAFDLAMIFAHFSASKNFAVNIGAKSAYLKSGL